MPVAGPRIFFVEGVQYFYDKIRDKVISVDRVYLRSGVKHEFVTNRSMRLEDGQPAFSVGDALPRPATIISMTANCESNATWDFEVYKRGNPALIASLPLSSEDEKSDKTLNIDLDIDDVLLFKASGTNIPYPRGMVEIAWRLT